MIRFEAGARLLRNVEVQERVSDGNKWPHSGAHQATTQRYAHLSNDPLRAAADEISGQIADAMTAGTGSAEVVNLRGKR